jgi:cytochrome P450
MNAQARIANSSKAGRDDRKTAQLSERSKPFPVTRIAAGFALAREILCTAGIDQRRPVARALKLDDPGHESFFSLDGERHRERRAAVAPCFTPQAVVTRYRPLMDRTMDELIAMLQAQGSLALDEMSLQLASNVAMEIVGLTNSDNKRLTRVVRGMMSADPFERLPRIAQRLLKPLLMKQYDKRRQALVAEFYHDHIVPAAEARRGEPKADVMSCMVRENYSPMAMIGECQAYAGAAISTTREFIVLAAWQLFDHPDVMKRFLAGDEADQFAVLEEILRLDPIANFLYRQSTIDQASTTAAQPFASGEVYAIDIREANTDPEAVGDDRFALDPDRPKRMKAAGAWMSFGDGPHRCPGSQIALHESRVFLDRLLRVPGIRLAKSPQMALGVQTQGYELRGAIVACDKVR